MESFFTGTDWLLQLNFAYPATGAQKLIDIEDELKVRFFYDRRMGAEVELDSLGPEYKVKNRSACGLVLDLLTIFGAGICLSGFWRKRQTGISHETRCSDCGTCSVADVEGTFLLSSSQNW